MPSLMWKTNETLGTTLKIFLILTIFYEIFSLGSLLLGTYHCLPWFDEWDTINLFLKISKTDEWASTLYSQHNEHRLFIPRLFFIADFWLFRAKNIFTFSAMIGFLIASVCTFGKALAINCNQQFGSIERLIVIAVLISGHQASNFIWAFQIQWIALNFFIILSITQLALVTKSQPHKKHLHITLSIISAICATLCTASGMLIWPTLLFFLLILRRQISPKLSILFLIAGVVSTSAYLYGLNKTSAVSENFHLFLQNPKQIFTFYFAYLGGAFDILGLKASILAGIVIGGAAAVFSIILYQRKFIENDTAMAFCYSIFLFLLLAAAITTIGRFNLGLSAATESRFSSTLMLGYSAMLIIISRNLSLRQNSGRNSAIRSVLFSKNILVLSLVISVSIFCFSSWKKLPYDYFPLKNIKSLAASALITDVHDTDALERIGFTSRFNELVPFLRRTQTSIFDGAAAASYGHNINEFFPHIRQDCIGAIDTRLDIDNHGMRVGGWAYDFRSQQAPAELILVNEQGLIVGVGFTTEKRPDVQEYRPDIKVAVTGWQGHAMKSGDKFLAYGIVDSNSSLCLVSGWMPFNNQG